MQCFGLHLLPYWTPDFAESQRHRCWVYTRMLADQSLVNGRLYQWEKFIWSHAERLLIDITQQVEEISLISEKSRTGHQILPWWLWWLAVKFTSWQQNNSNWMNIFLKSAFNTIWSHSVYIHRHCTNIRQSIFFVEYPYINPATDKD